MLTVLEIKFIPYDVTDSQSKGRVEIFYSDGTIDSFGNVERAKFFRWERYGWLKDDQPVQVEMRSELFDDDEDD
jgi:hypothetical protein